MKQTLSRATAIGKLRDIASHVDFRNDPFLYYLPKLIESPEFVRENPEKVLEFAQLSRKRYSTPIVKDALHVLNQLVNSEDGTLLTRGPDIFYQNRTFVWKELGDHIKPIDIISHILNRTLFFLSMGK